MAWGLLFVAGCCSRLILTAVFEISKSTSSSVAEGSSFPERSEVFWRWSGEDLSLFVRLFIMISFISFDFDDLFEFMSGECLRRDFYELDLFGYAFVPEAMPMLFC